MSRKERKKGLKCGEVMHTGELINEECCFVLINELKWCLFEDVVGSCTVG